VVREPHQESKARELAALSTSSLSEDPERSILLGMQAVHATLRFGQPAVGAAEDALHQAILSSQVRMTLRAYGQNSRRARCPTHELHFNRRFMINHAR
jgi:hypothetical protein